MRIRIIVLVIVILVPLTALLAYLKVIDWNQAITTVWVGIVVGILILLIDHLLFGEKDKLEQKDAQRRKLEGYLKTHHENDLLPVIRAWLERPKRHSFAACKPLEYSLLSASAHYHPHGKYNITEISEPTHLQENIVKEVIEHLRTGYHEVWDKWISLKKAINDHLSSVVQKLKEIEEDVKVIAEELGLVAWDGKGGKPTTDYYSIRKLVEGIWGDPEHYQKHEKHTWDGYEIYLEGEGFTFGGIWAYSLRRQVLEELKRRLTNESHKITAENKKLEEERSHLESEGKNVKNSLKNIEEDYLRRHIWIRSSCSTCKEWHDELAELGEG